MAIISQKDIVAIIQRGGVGVLATDTLYGVIGSALSKKAVARIYRLRKRDLKKPLIILIASMRDLARFGVKADTQTKKALNAVWPGKVSVVLPCLGKKYIFAQRHRDACVSCAGEYSYEETSAKNRPISCAKRES